MLEGANKMTSTCAIKRVDGRKAVIAKFTNGRLKEGKSSLLEFKHLTNGEDLEDRNSKGDHTKSRSVLIAERDTDTCQTYIGDTQNNSLSSQFYNYYVGVRNKRTGKMKVFDAELFHMIPDVKVESKKEENLEKLLPMSYTDQMKELTKAFGSTKRQRLVTQAQKNELKEDVLESAIGSAVDHAVSQENYSEIMAKKPTEESSCLPLHHLDCEKLEDIYKAEEIIGDKVMAAITNLTQKLFDFKTEDFQNEEEFGHYIMNRLPILPLDETRRWEKCRCLLYIHCLIVLYRKKANELRAKEILPKDWPDLLKQSLLNNFTLKVAGDGKKKPYRCMSVRMKDKIILHILVLCLLVDNFTLEYSDILKDLKIGEKRMPLLLRSVGCQIKSRVINKVNVRTAHLTAPLQLPSQNLLSSKRK